LRLFTLYTILPPREAICCRKVQTSSISTLFCVRRRQFFCKVVSPSISTLFGPFLHPREAIFFAEKLQNANFHQILPFFTEFSAEPPPLPGPPWRIQVGLVPMQTCMGLGELGEGLEGDWGRLPLPCSNTTEFPHTDIALQQRPSAPRRRTSLMSIANMLVRRVCGRSADPRQMGRRARGGPSRM
jgi:hypothetical protein